MSLFVFTLIGKSEISDQKTKQKQKQTKNRTLLVWTIHVHMTLKYLQYCFEEKGIYLI